MTGRRDSEDAIGEEAAAWFLRLRALGTEAEEYKRFAAWRAADPAHRAAFAEVEAIWDRMGRLPPGQEAVAAHAVSRRQWLRGVPPMAALGCLTAAGAAWVLHREDEQDGTIRTRPGRRSDARLADGLRLALDAASTAAWADTASLRQVTLLAGQGLAEVTADRDGRPFELRVAGLGGLRLRDASAGTLVAKRVGEGGRVALLAASGPAEAWAASGGPPIPLLPGSELTLGPADTMRPRQIDPETAGGWRWGRLVYRNTPLGEVVEDLARHRGGWIVLADAALRRLRVTAALDADDPNGALEALAATLPIRLVRLPSLAVLRPA